jgi:hypothetical protein
VPETVLPQAPRALVVAVLLAVPVASTVVGALAMPRPVSAADSAETARARAPTAVSSTKPTVTSPVDVVLGNKVRVLGADLPTSPVARGGKLSARFYFEAMGELDRDWQVFVHVDARGASSRINGDHDPVGGKLPTTLWQKGDVVTDEWSRSVPLDAPAGTWDVYVGLYLGNERLPVTSGDASTHDGQNRIRVGTLTIE